MTMFTVYPIVGGVDCCLEKKNAFLFFYSVYDYGNV